MVCFLFFFTWQAVRMDTRLDRLGDLTSKEHHDVFFDDKKAGNCDGSNMIRSMLSSTNTKETPSSLLEQSDLFIMCN